MDAAGESLSVDVWADVRMRAVVGGDHRVLIQAVVTDVRPGSAFGHEAIAPYGRRSARIDLERDVGRTAVGHERREVPLAARLRGDRCPPPAPPPPELRDGPFERLTDRRVAGTDQTPGQLAKPGPPNPEAHCALGPDRVHRHATAQDLHRLDERIV